MATNRGNAGGTAGANRGSPAVARNNAGSPKPAVSNSNRADSGAGNVGNPADAGSGNPDAGSGFNVRFGNGDARTGSGRGTAKGKTDALKNASGLADVGKEKAKKSTKDLSAQEAKDIADALLVLFNTGAVLATEVPEAALTNEEFSAVHEPLERILKRMTPGASRKFQALADPISLVVCFGMWANRVMPLVQQRNNERKQNAQQNYQSNTAVHEQFSTNGKTVGGDGSANH